MPDLKVLIINPPVRFDDKPRNLPHGLAILANIIRNKMNITPQFLDINAFRYSPERLSEILKTSDFNVVLIGGIASAYRQIVELSRLVKEIVPQAMIIAGGYVVMPVPTLLLQNSAVDIVCTGEGELTIVELLDRLSIQGFNADISDIAGVCYKPRTGAPFHCTGPRRLIDDLDATSAMPAYDLLPMDVYLSNPVVGIGRDIDMVTIRGCPYQCSFCYQPWGRVPRSYSIDTIAGTIHTLRREYRVDFISFQDDEFMVDETRVKEFCERRNRLFPEVLWSCTGRSNIIARNPDIVKLMKQSGCTLISCGFESGSPRMLESMHKMQRIDQMEATVKILRAQELPVPASFIIGMPGEDEASCQETLDFCLRNNLPLESLMFATPYPGTEIFDFALKTGRVDKDHIHEFMMELGDARKFVVNLTDSFSDEGLVATRTEMMAIARKNYEKFISQNEIMDKMKKLFGPLLERVRLDETDLAHRAKHGGMSTF
ncbi:MAG: radical SAM protein [Candidatus Omnitrophica bacterium]|nr:radical SAM protein [Candidatus Omnitrophota bacterium]